MTKIRKAYRFQIKTNQEIESRLSGICGCARFLWNKCLAMNLTRLECGQRILWYNEQAFWLTLWKRSLEYGFLKQCPSQVLQQKLMDLDRAFRDAFDRGQPLKRLPVFKKKDSGDSIRFPQGFLFENRRVFLPRVGWVGFFKSRDIVGKIKNITISSRAARWYMSVQVEQEVRISPHPSSSEIGIDAGIMCFAAFSDGT
ncbi:MAG: transposase, partial [Bacteroidetes bacterium]